MEMLDRYIAEIGRQLPEKSRTDIEREIRSSIEDMLDDRASKSGKPVDEDLVMDILKEFGSPSKVAASYQTEQYLIGPRLFPLFLLIVKIAVPIILIIGTIGFIFQMSRGGWTPSTFGGAFLTGLASLVNSAIQVFGSITIVFAILERVVPGLKVELDDKKWDPHKLPKVPASPDKVSIPSLAVEISFTVIALVLFNFYPQLIGVGYTGTQWVAIPILTETFFTRYLPFINIVWIAEVIVAVLLISRGRWETITKWLYTLVKILTILLALVILTGPSILAITPELLASKSAMGIDTAKLLVDILRQVVRGALVLVIFFSGLDLVQLLWKRMTYRRDQISFAS